MSRRVKPLPLGATLLALLVWCGAAATELTVDGQTVPGLDQQTVAGVSYAPATALAGAMGAELASDDHTVSLKLGASQLRLRITGDVVRTDSPGSVALDGRALDGHAAVMTDAGLLLPVKTVVSAFGGFVTVLTGNRDAVEVRMPQARLTELLRSTAGGTERLLVDLSAPVPVSVYLNEPLGTLQVTFQRTRVTDGLQPVQGVNFGQAWLIESGGSAELRVQLAAGTSHQVSATATASGWQLELGFAPPVETSPEAPTGETGPRQMASLLLDHAGGQALSDLVQATGNLLQAEGVRLLPAGSDPAAAGLHLLLGSGAGPSELHYLADAGDEHGLELALALSGTDRASLELLRRELLLGMHGDTLLARTVANGLQQQLGLERPPVGLPDAGLARRPGGTIRLLLSRDDLGDPGLPERLGEALLEVLPQLEEAR